jgi:hypothetical protein
MKTVVGWNQDKDKTASSISGKGTYDIANKQLQF